MAVCLQTWAFSEINMSKNCIIGERQIVKEKECIGGGLQRLAFTTISCASVPPSKVEEPLELKILNS